MLIVIMIIMILSPTARTQVELDVASDHLWGASQLDHELLTGLQQLTMRLATGAAPVGATLTWKEVAGAAKSHTLTAAQGVSLCSPVSVRAL